MAGEYPLLDDFENTGYEKSYFIRGIRDQVSSILEMKVYWISAYGNSSLEPEIHIHYLKNPARLDSTLICVCMIPKKTIQYAADCEIVDIFDFSISVTVGMMMIFEAYHACACKFFAASGRGKFEASS